MDSWSGRLFRHLFVRQGSGFGFQHTSQSGAMSKIASSSRHVGCSRRCATFLPQLVDMACTNITREQRHLACPAQSCFCTDCDPSNMLLNMFLRRLWGSPADAVSPHWRPMRPWQDFSCKLGIDLNRCGITLLFNFLWLGLTLRLAWRVRSLLRKGSAQTRLLHVAGIICRLCATTAVPMLKPLLPNSIRLAIVTLKYEAINTLLLAASLFGPLGLLLRPKNPYHLKVPKGDDKRYDSLAADFLKSFLIFAFVGEMGIMLLAASTDSTGDKVVVQQHLFYSIYLLLGCNAGTWLKKTGRLMIISGRSCGSFSL